MNLTHRPAHASSSSEFAWKIVTAFPTYDMFASLILLSLMAVLLIPFSRRIPQPEIVGSRRQGVRTCMERLSAESCLPAHCDTVCSGAAVYMAGAPPGLHTVSLNQVPRFSSSSGATVVQPDSDQHRFIGLPASARPATHDESKQLTSVTQEPSYIRTFPWNISPTR